MNRDIIRKREQEADIHFRILTSGQRIILVGVFSLLLLSPFISIALR